MHTGFLGLMAVQLLGILTASLPRDVAPPVGVFAGLTAVVIGGLCVLVLVMIVAAALVIWLIKKNQTGKKNS